jgi:exonuclease SbcC
LQVEFTDVTAAIAALATRDAAQADLDLRQTEWADALNASAFAGRDQVRAALVTDEVRAELRGLINARIASRAESEAALRSPELADLDLDAVVDVDAASAASVAADQARQQAEAVRAGLVQRREGSTVRAGEVQSSLTAERAVHAATEPVIRMADLASASTPDNAKSMTLPTFVLRERFVDVVASANDRLATMSDGRYRLEHLEGKRGNKRSGLELQVRDTHTEHPRDPATLSGGESFYCSLALALGLADVVTAEAGGVDLGTLFVDEGFGSLDADTLEHVLEVLHGLASNGRAVGIVSHVPELKEQITERISVVPNRDGSSRLVVAA